MLTHSNFDAALKIHKQHLSMITENDTSMCFLPLSHIFEKAWTYFCLYMGIEVYINRNPKEMQQTIKSATHYYVQCAALLGEGLRAIQNNCRGQPVCRRK